jgi:SAM-dependent methyltransferase
MARWLLMAERVAGRRILAASSWKFAKVAAQNNIRFANAIHRIPCADNSVEVVYSSHMIEHLDRSEAQSFLREVKRVLRPGGILRVAAPDISRIVDLYVATGDADEFVAGTNMSLAKSTDLLSRMRLALTGPRHHLWMYDGRSLTELLSNAGFNAVSTMPPGKTNIANPGRLDLEERAEESVYVEGVRSGDAGDS